MMGGEAEAVAIAEEDRDVERRGQACALSATGGDASLTA